MADAVPNRTQQGNQASVDLQIARREVPICPHDPRTTAARDWLDKAKASGLI